MSIQLLPPGPRCPPPLLEVQRSHIRQHCLDVPHTQTETFRYLHCCTPDPSIDCSSRRGQSFCRSCLSSPKALLWAGRSCQSYLSMAECTSRISAAAVCADLSYDHGSGLAPLPIQADLSLSPAKRCADSAGKICCPGFGTGRV